MFKKLEPLIHETHMDLRFTHVNNFDFARNISSAPISYSEFLQASSYYPILFLKESNSPVLLLSLIENQNNFINEDGSWKVPYIPAFIRQYPFVLAKADQDNNSGNTASGAPNGAEANEESERKYIVCIDREASHFANTQGEIMFTANGDFAEITKQSVNFIQLFQKELLITSAIVKLLSDNGVLADRKINTNINGQIIAIEGFCTVDIDKLNALPDSTLADWVRRGIIPLITYHINSIAGLELI